MKYRAAKLFSLTLTVLLLLGILPAAAVSADDIAVDRCTKIAEGAEIVSGDTYLFMANIASDTGLTNSANRLLTYNFGTASFAWNNTGATNLTLTNSGSNLEVNGSLDNRYVYKIVAASTSNGSDKGYYIQQGGQYLAVTQILQAPTELAVHRSVYTSPDNSTTLELSMGTTLTYPYTYLTNSAYVWYWDGTSFYCLYTSPDPDSLGATAYLSTSRTKIVPWAAGEIPDYSLVHYENGVPSYVNLDKYFYYSDNNKYCLNEYHNAAGFKMYLAAMNPTAKTYADYGSMTGFLGMSGSVLSVTDYDVVTATMNPGPGHINTTTQIMAAMNNASGNPYVQVVRPSIYHTGSYYPVSVTVNKDSAGWASVSVNLYQNGSLSRTLTANSSGVATAASVKAGSYNVYVDGKDTGQTLTIGEGLDNALTLNFFTLTVNSGTGGGVYLSGTSVPIVPDAEPADKIFYRWTIVSNGITSYSTTKNRSIELTEPTTATATYQDAVQVTVTGGTVNGVASGKFARSATLTIAAVAPTGQHFVSWTGSNGSTAINLGTKASQSSFPIQLSTSVASFTAAFANDVYTVTFDPQNGSATSAASAEYNNTVALPAAPVKAGYTFGGWFTAVNGGGTEFTAATKLTGTQTVYARWDTPVASVTISDTGKIGTPLALSATVAPAAATNKTVVWSLADAGTAQASLAGSTLTASAVGTAKVTATIAQGLSRTSDFVQTYTVTFNKATPALTVTATPVTSFYGSEVTFTATFASGYNPTGTVRFLDGATLLGTADVSGNTASLKTSSLAAMSHVINFAYYGDANNEKASEALNFAVTKAAQTMDSSLTAAAVEPERIALAALAPNANQATAEYRIDGGAWQASPIFSGLVPETTYSFEARWSATLNYEASPAGAALTLKTPAYSLIKGDKQRVAQGSSSLFSSNASFEKFRSVEVDGNVVADTDYKAAAGSTDITLHADYTSGLSLGEHTIAIISADGRAEGTFTVIAKPAPADTGTADQGRLWALIALAALAAYAAGKSRQRQN